MNKALRDEAMKLTTAEKIELAYELWESIPPGGEQLELTPDQIRELDRRLEAYERDPSRGIPLQEFLARLESRFG